MSLPNLLNIHKSWTDKEKTQILPTNKFPDGKRWHIQRNLTNQNPAQKFPAIPVFSLVKKDVGTLSPHFLCQTSDPLIRKAVIQRYHVTHRYAIELNKRLCLAWHRFKKNVYHTQDNQEAHIPTQSYLLFSFLQCFSAIWIIFLLNKNRSCVLQCSPTRIWAKLAKKGMNCFHFLLCQTSLLCPFLVPCTKDDTNQIFAQNSSV